MRRLFVASIAVAFLSPLLAVGAEPVEVAPGVLQLGTFANPGITESSGVTPSRRSRGFYWTHNDGEQGTLYAFTTNGTAGGEYQITGGELNDWEDIVSSGSRLYIADIGNNTGSRGNIDVYYVKEPRATRFGEVRLRKHWTLNYPADPFDAESFFVARGYGHVLSKELQGGEASLYRFRLGSRSQVTLDEQCRLNVDAPPTGASITADKRRLAVITDEGAYLFEFARGRIPTEGKLEPTLFVPYLKDGMEGCTFTRHGLLVTSESREIFLFTDPLFRLKR
jgi:hypothetical protein